MSFWEELRRRNVVKVGLAYLVVAWLLVQVVDVVLPMFDAPDWVGQTITFVLALCFPIVLIIAWAFEITPEGIKQTQHVPREESITHLTGQKLNYIVTGLLVLAVAFMAVDNYVLEGSGEPVAEQPVTTPSEAAAEIPGVREQQNQGDALPNSVAVLPFENLSPDPNNAYFAAGIHEEILNQLAKLRNLNVISRTTMMQYAEQRKPLPEIARELNVGAVMEGSVRYAGNRIRVTMQLIDAMTDQHLWSETYEREFDDIFAIESDIAMNVANALEAEFSDDEQQRIERRPTDSAAAYGLYLQASALVDIGGQAPRIHTLLDQAIAMDPDFALAHGLKAWVFANTLINTAVGSAQSRSELEPQVRQYANRALEIDPETPDALWALAQLASSRWNWSEAREAFDRSYELTNSSAGEATWFKAWSGDEAGALTIAERQVDLDPLWWATHWTRGIVLGYAGEHEAAAAEFRDGIALAPTLSLQHSWLGTSEVALGNTAEAARELQLAEQLLGDNRNIISLLDIAYGYGRIGDRENAQRLFDEISAVAERGQDIGAGGWALAHLAIGNVNEALEWLERGADKASRHEPDAGYYSLMNIRMNYTGDPLLERPEFADVRNRLRGD
jgi:TolB-like protein